MIIDIEDIVFTRVANAARSAVPTVKVEDQYTYSPSSFPHVSVVEADNRSDTESMPLDQNPVAANLMYEINVHSNKSAGRKREAKAIMASIDDAMQEMKFVRTFMNPISNLENATIYRIVARYTKTSTGGI